MNNNGQIVLGGFLILIVNICGLAYVAEQLLYNLSSNPDFNDLLISVMFFLITALSIWLVYSGIKGVK